MAKTEAAAKAAVIGCAGVKPGETVLIVTDARTEAVAEALFRASPAASTFLLKIPVGKQHGAEPPKMAADAMRKADVVFCPTAFSLTHTNAVKAARKNARIATMPGINEEMFQRAVDIDYQSLGKKAEKLAEALAKAGKAHVTTGSGTDISFSVAGRKIEQDTGLLRKRGDITNLPAGEVYVSPDEGTSNGLVVVDHMADICRPKTRVAVHNGVAQEVDGDERFRAMLWSAKNGRNVAEFGIGLNPKAVLSGDVLEDEKALGTCHIAFGSSFAIGGRVHADVHLDAILLNPTITFDGRKIMAGGELLL